MLATLDQVKTYIGNSADASDDALLQRLIAAASSAIERACDRTLAQTLYVEHRNGNGGTALSLRNFPVTSVTAVSINGLSLPEATTWDSSGWALEAPNRLRLLGGRLFTTGLLNVRVTYTAGYSSFTMPPDIVQACCLMTSLAYKERDRLGLDSKTINGETVNFTSDEMPPSVQAVVAEHRAVWSA